jgi:hypothetical protein
MIFTAVGDQHRGEVVEAVQPGGETAGIDQDPGAGLLGQQPTVA